MGVSTDGLLYYGIELCDVDGEYDLKNAIFEYLGLGDNPKDEYGYPLSLYSFFEKLGKEMGVTFECHGSDKCPAWVVATSYSCAWRASPKDVTSIIRDEIHPYSEWKRILKLVCEAIGVDYSEPKWWLASYWG